MWPWEHAIVGYLAYSLFCHVVFRDAPGGLEAFAVVSASLFPDVVDKVLSWQFGVFQTGYALAHSVYFAVPFAIALGLVARWAGRPRAGLAFGVGYLLHPPADIFDTLVRSGYLEPRIVLWPVDPAPGQERGVGLLDEFWRLLGYYQQELFAGELSTYRWVQLGLVGAAALLWLYDGAPVLRELLQGAKRLLERTAGQPGRQER